jgi:large subunit ribosomal protein L6
VKVEPNEVTITGPKGTLSQKTHSDVIISFTDGIIKVSLSPSPKADHAIHGLIRSLLNNAIIGVTSGYQKSLEIMGVGYRAQQSGNGITLNVGFSHPVEVSPPAGVTITMEDNNKIVVDGIDKQQVGEVAANIRRIRPPNAYKAKGIKYSDEQLRFKPGKAAAKTLA